MGGVNALPLAVLLHLNALSVVLAILGRNIVTPLAVLASQRDLNSLFVLCHFSLHPHNFYAAGLKPPSAHGSGGRTRTDDPTIMSRVL